MNSELMKFVELMLSLNIPFEVTSAKRSYEQNVRCGGVPTSQHLTGDAIDFCQLSKSPTEVCNWIRANDVQYDQLIRYNTFVHISFARNKKPRKMYLDYSNK